MLQLPHFGVKVQHQVFICLMFLEFEEFRTTSTVIAEDCSQHVNQNVGPWDFPGGTVVKNPPPRQGTQVRALVREDPTCHGVTKPLRHNY